MDVSPSIFATGLGATLVVDAWAFAREKLFHVPRPNYGLLGRWIAHMPRGRFVHASIASAHPVRGERALGWIAHYLIGVAFAGLLVVVAGSAWYRAPSLAPALLVGVATVLAPFLLMQPGMGAGIAARRTPRPGAARIQSLLTHAVFGLGLYAASSHRAATPSARAR
jgi:hypothetical protein